MACRDTAKAERAVDDIVQSAQGLSNVGQLVIRELDLSSLESVRKCANTILETESAIHLLVNNAGIMACPKYLSQDGYELQFATNHLGHFLFTLLLLPRILASAPARIVSVASGVGDKLKMGWFWSSNCESANRLDGKTVVITGCNTGLGLETAREFYKRGGKIVMACRDTAKAERAVDDIVQSAQGLSNVGQLVVRELDLSSLESVRKCANTILETESAIHLLVNNAGVITSTKLLSQDGYELQFATNHLGHFLFTLLLLPRITASAPARIVNVASLGYTFGDGQMHLEDLNYDNHNYTASGAYGRSKLANILFAAELGRRLKGTGVTTYAVHPGIILETELVRHMKDSSPWLSWIWTMVVRPFSRTIIQGIQTILYCSLDDKCANETGQYYAECRRDTLFYRARNKKAAKELWDESLKLVKLEDCDPFKPLEADP